MDDDALETLVHHWGDAYEISHDALGWHAVRRDGRGELTAGDPDGLIRAISADYRARPVSRDVA